MKVSKISNSKIQRLDFITLRDLPQDYLIITLSEGFSLEIPDDNTIHIRKKGVKDDNKN